MTSKVNKHNLSDSCYR